MKKCENQTCESKGELLPYGVFSKNQNTCKKCKKKYYQENKEKIKNKQNNYYHDNKEVILEKMVVHYQENKEEIKLKQRIRSYKTYHTPEGKLKRREYYEKNRERHYEASRKHIKNKYKNDEEFRLNTKLKLQIIKYLKQHQNLTKIPIMLGYDIKDFIRVVGSPKDGEEIDHKVPISWFKENTPHSIIWDLRNLQILSKGENRTKGNRYHHHIEKEYEVEITEHIKPKYLKQL